jgi:hypothetical protein
MQPDRQKLKEEIKTLQEYRGQCDEGLWLQKVIDAWISVLQARLTKDGM